ncbi:MAG: hypothetical protein CLLPBCKN_003146 [Chroococcidiopsis cubana SAG 39.79]|nr:hypothetical protein [Chroococcidiopsis cubana SAG 39.79]PSB65809.1 hypothetical protein C7B79_03820 [Chroococcidiopsis cubana CCALA 043]
MRTFFLAPFLRGLGDRKTTPMTQRSPLTPFMKGGDKRKSKNYANDSKIPPNPPYERGGQEKVVPKRNYF